MAGLWDTYCDQELNSRVEHALLFSLLGQLLAQLDHQFTLRLRRFLPVEQ